MKLNNKKVSLKIKLGVGLAILVLAVVSFLAANDINEMQVEETKAGNISVEFKDADVQDVFRVLALKGNISIVADPDVKGLITVHITDVPWETVLDTICKTYAYAYEREGNIIRVTTLEKQGLESLVTEVFTLNYAKAKDVAAAVNEIKSERGKIKFDERSNLVIVTDIPTNIYKVAKVINRLDAKTPQVTIEARIIETTLSNDERMGMKWNVSAQTTLSKRPTTLPWHRNKGYGDDYGRFLPLGDDAAAFHSTSNPSFPLATSDDFSFGVLDASSFSILLEAISSRSKTKILSNPRITTMDNQPAKIHVGTDWPIANYSYNEETDRFVITGWEYKSYGILLEVTPTINKDGYVTLKLHPEISDKQDVVSFQGADVPVLSTQNTEATVMVKDGETLVVGGLLKDKVITTKTKMPILGDIPILGLFFSHKSDTVEKKDLLIFITPHIVSSEKLAMQKQVINATVPESSTYLQLEKEMKDMDIEELLGKEAVEKETEMQKKGEIIIEPTQKSTEKAVVVEPKPSIKKNEPSKVEKKKKEAVAETQPEGNKGIIFQNK